MSTTYMDGLCHRNSLHIASNEEEINLTVTKNSYKTMTKTVAKDTSLKLIFINLRS